LRLAWLALPPWLLEPVVEAKRLADHHSSALDQLVLADLLASGAFDRHLRRCRLGYRRRRDRLGAAVDGLGLHWHSAGPHPAGLVVGYATPPEHAFTGALEPLIATLAELYQNPARRAPHPT
jgi:GntR family transcriptional regulator/MocR family aminotransferase